MSNSVTYALENFGEYYKKSSEEARIREMKDIVSNFLDKKTAHKLAEETIEELDEELLSMDKCPNCEEGAITIIRGREMVEYFGTNTTMETEVAYACDNCNFFKEID